MRLLGDVHFKIIDVDNLVTYKELLQEAKAVKDAWNYDGLMIDPYNSLAKDKQLMRNLGGHEYDYQVASELRLFAKEKEYSTIP